MKQKGNVWAVALALVLTLGLTGCGEEETKLEGANAQIREMDYIGALATLEEAEEAGENDRLIQRSRGIAYMGLAEYELAIHAFSDSLAGSNGFISNLDFDTNYYLAAAYTKNGEYAEAEATYNAILALRTQADAFFLRGNVRMHLDDFEGARADFEQAMAMNPTDYDRLIEIYEILDHFGYKGLGQEYLQTALTGGEKQMSTEVVGRIYYYLGEYQKACLALEEARQKGGLNSYLYLGRAYEATGDYNYASSVYNSYLTKYEGNPELYNQLGLCEMAKGEYEKALVAFQAGMQSDDNALLQTLSFNEIVAYEYLGDFEQAYALICNYRRNYPGDEKAEREYQFLCTR